jgi:hypothetical protein
VHISLAHDFYKALRNTSTHSGILITSGYTSDREEDITKAMNDVGLVVCDRAQIDEWIAIAFLRVKSAITLQAEILLQKYRDPTYYRIFCRYRPTRP